MKTTDKDIDYLVSLLDDAMDKGGKKHGNKCTNR